MMFDPVDDSGGALRCPSLMVSGCSFDLGSMSATWLSTSTSSTSVPTPLSSREISTSFVPSGASLPSSRSGGNWGSGFLPFSCVDAAFGVAVVGVVVFGVVVFGDVVLVFGVTSSGA
jgi:hypothetical protein